MTTQTIDRARSAPASISDLMRAEVEAAVNKALGTTRGSELVREVNRIPEGMLPELNKQFAEYGQTIDVGGRLAPIPGRTVRVENVLSVDKIDDMVPALPKIGRIPIFSIALGGFAGLLVAEVVSAKLGFGRGDGADSSGKWINNMAGTKVNWKAVGVKGLIGAVVTGVGYKYIGRTASLAFGAILLFDVLRDIFPIDQWVGQALGMVNNGVQTVIHRQDMAQDPSGGGSYGMSQEMGQPAPLTPPSRDRLRGVF